MDKNRIEGTARQGGSVNSHKALVIKAKWRKLEVYRKGVSSYLGRSRLTPERATGQPGEGPKECKAKPLGYRNLMPQMLTSVQLNEAGAGEARKNVAVREPVSSSQIQQS